jgi:hypothetical protein
LVFGPVFEGLCGAHRCVDDWLWPRVIGCVPYMMGEANALANRPPHETRILATTMVSFHERHWDYAAAFRDCCVRGLVAQRNEVN